MSGGLRAAAEEALAYTGRFKWALDFHAAEVLALLDERDALAAKVARVGAEVSRLAAKGAEGEQYGWTVADYDDLVDGTVCRLRAALGDQP